MIERINAFLDKYLIWLTPFSVALALLLPFDLTPFSRYTDYFFFVLTFCGSITISFRRFVKSLSFKSISVFLVLGHVVIPAVVFLILRLFFSPDDPNFIGMMIVFAVPSAITSSVWAGVFNANIGLSIFFIATDTALGFLVTPFTMKVLCGTVVQVDTVSMMKSMLIMVVIPFILGMTFNSIGKDKAVKTVQPYTKVISKAMVSLIVIVNVSKVKDTLLQRFDFSYLLIVVLQIVLFTFALALGLLGGIKLLKMGRDDALAMSFGTGMRNLGMALVLAGMYFPPLSVVPSVLGMLYQDAVTIAFGKMASRKLSLRSEKVSG